MTSVCCIIVDFEGASWTAQCLEALARSTLVPEIIVVDNNPPLAASNTSGNVSALDDALANAPDNLECRKVSAGGNSGFARACNLGASHAMQNPETEWLWFLNNDALVEPETLARLLAGASEARLDIAGVEKIVETQADGTRRVCAGAGRIHPRWGTVLPLVPGTTPDYIDGVSLLVRRKTWIELGGLPEDYFLYFEETDWCFQARNAGKSSGLVAGTTLHHRRGATTGSARLPGQVPLFIDVLQQRNRLLFMRRYLGKTGWPRLSSLLSLLLRLRRGQWNRVWHILRVSWSHKAFWRWVAQHGGQIPPGRTERT
jgi:GT2 family glycosyltransferase